MLGGDAARRRRPPSKTPVALRHAPVALRQLIHQLFDAGKQGFLGARDVPEYQFERTVESVFLGLALYELEHPFRVNLILLLKQDVAAAGAGGDLADAERGGAQLKGGSAK